MVRFLLRKEAVIAPNGDRRPFFLPLSRGGDLPPFRRLAAAGELGPPGLGGVRHDMAGECRRTAAGVPVFTGGERRAHGEGQKGKRAPGMVPFPPLDSPKPSFEPLSKAFAAKRGKRGLGSVRLSACGTLYCPEFPLRYPPRITVRGQTVQGGGVLLRKAPLPSSVVPWSTKRHCGPLAFRRATEGSRVRGKMWGCQEGDKKPGGCLGPLLSPPGEPGIPRPPKAANVRAHLERKPRLRRRTAVSAETNPLLRVKEKRTHIRA